jgi:hypothetical protein
MQKLYNENAPWYRGNLHTHTTLTDGRLDPEEAIRRYKAEGYSFLAISDHRVFYKYYEEEGFTLLGGTELDDNDFETRSAWHIIGVGMTQAAEFTRGEKAPRLVKAIHEAGGIAVLGHPVWSLLSHQDMIGLDGIFATEIYSGISEAYTGRGDSTEYVDTCAAKGCKRMLLGVDDAHFYDRDVFQAWIMLQAPSLHREDIMAALLAGSFYATEGGPGFRQITVNEDTIEIQCEPSQTITFFSDTFWCPDRVYRATDAPLCSAVYAIQRQDRFVRVQLADEKGKRSTSQYIDVNRE